LHLLPEPVFPVRVQVGEARGDRPTHGKADQVKRFTQFQFPGQRVNLAGEKVDGVIHLRAVAEAPAKQVETQHAVTLAGAILLAVFSLRVSASELRLVPQFRIPSERRYGSWNVYKCTATIFQAAASLTGNAKKEFFVSAVNLNREEDMTHKMVVLVMTTIFAWPLSVAIAGGADPVEEEQIVIALSTDDFELAETDLSHMEVGDAESFTTDSGKRIDLLRTETGVEIYVDGEMIEAGTFGDDELHLGHKVVDAHVEVICHSENDCEKTVLISGDEDIDIDVEELHIEDHLHGEHQHGEHHEKVIIISKESETSSH
jgi:hypothetical protein